MIEYRNGEKNAPLRVRIVLWSLPGYMSECVRSAGQRSCHSRGFCGRWLREIVFISHFKMLLFVCIRLFMGIGWLGCCWRVGCQALGTVEHEVFVCMYVERKRERLAHTHIHNVWLNDVLFVIM